MGIHRCGHVLEHRELLRRDFGDCTLTTSSLYTQRIFWSPAQNQWNYTNSACAGQGQLGEPSTDDKVEQSTSYAGNWDFMESAASAAYFDNAAGTVEFNPSLQYLSGGTWYNAASSWIGEFTYGTNSGDPGAEYSCSTPYIFVTSGFGGPWSLGSGGTGTWACT